MKRRWLKKPIIRIYSDHLGKETTESKLKKMLQDYQNLVKIQPKTPSLSITGLIS